MGNSLSLARFHSRINDAIGPLLGADVDLKALLSNKSVLLSAPESLEEHPLQLAGFMLATNLCARLYPRLYIVAPARVFEQCFALSKQINPQCDVERGIGRFDGELAWATGPRSAGNETNSTRATRVAPSHWSVLLNSPDAEHLRPTNILTSLAAATVGVSELFRQVFAELMPAGKSRPSTGGFNLLTHAEANPNVPDLPPAIDLGRVHLVGAGAIGQAALYTLARLGARGTIVIVDPESITLSNLQRYVLTLDADVGVSKCAVAARALQGSQLNTVRVEKLWGQDDASASLECVCTAVDSAESRIAIQASLPRRIYNAWTQADDLGWSRHEQFGVAPCLACLYWPTRARPHYYELIASALRQDPLRVLSYLVPRIAADVPLRKELVPVLQNMPIPAAASEWYERSILEDVATARSLSIEALAAWRGRPLTELYHEGICGGALVRHEADIASTDVAVPLAHQSVLAGIMLATQVVVASVPELAEWRPAMTEGRLDLLAPMPQMPARPRQRTPGCLCSDPDFLERFDAMWP